MVTTCGTPYSSLATWPARLAYQVWLCTTSVPAQPAAISRSTPIVRSAALAPARPAGSAYAVTPGSSRGRAEAVHPHVGEAAQVAGEVLHVHAGAAVDLRRVLAGQQVDTKRRGLHSGTLDRLSSHHTRRFGWCGASPPMVASTHGTQAEGPRDRPRRRRGQAPDAADRRPGQARRAVRRHLPADRLRPVEPRQRRLPQDRRADPVQDRTRSTGTSPRPGGCRRCSATT